MDDRLLMDASWSGEEASVIHTVWYLDRPQVEAIP